MLARLETLVRLQEVPLFAGIAPERLLELADRAVALEFEPDRTIFEEGSEGDQLLIVLSGQVSVEKRRGARTLVLSVMGPGNWFGEMALFEGIPRSATVRAASACRLLSLSGRDIRKIGREFPEIYESFLRTLSARLRQVSERVESGNPRAAAARPAGESEPPGPRRSKRASRNAARPGRAASFRKGKGR
jgi:CRP/FNR family transcriptional regulator